MPHCAFYNCFHSRRYKGASLFQIPVPRPSDGEFTSQRKQKARQGWIDATLRTRQLDADLRQQIESNSIYICEINFKDEYIERFPKRKSLETGSIPTENHPKKNLDNLGATSSNAYTSRKEPPERHVTERVVYPSLVDLDNYLKKAGGYPYFRGWGWHKTDDGTTTVTEFKDSECLIAKFSVRVDDNSLFLFMVGHCQMIMTSTLLTVDPCSTVALRHFVAKLCHKIFAKEVFLKNQI